MEKLFEKRVGAFLQHTPIRTMPNTLGDIYASYPLSKLTLYKDKLVIKVLMKGEFTLPYKNIKTIENTPLGIKINHYDKNILPYVYISGFGNGRILFEKIIKVVKENKLKVKVVKTWKNSK